jgi:hypothetical protein
MTCSYHRNVTHASTQARNPTHVHAAASVSQGTLSKSLSLKFGGRRTDPLSCNLGATTWRHTSRYTKNLLRELDQPARQINARWRRKKNSMNECLVFLKAWKMSKTRNILAPSLLPTAIFTPPTWLGPPITPNQVTTHSNRAYPPHPTDTRTKPVAGHNIMATRLVALYSPQTSPPTRPMSMECRNMGLDLTRWRVTSVLALTIDASGPQPQATFAAWIITPGIPARVPVLLETAQEDHITTPRRPLPHCTSSKHSLTWSTHSMPKLSQRGSCDSLTRMVSPETATSRAS